MTKWIIHYQRSRSWWDGSATTVCGKTITKVEYDDYGLGLGSGVTCEDCKAIKTAEKAAKAERKKAEKAAERALRAALPGRGWWW